MTTSKNRYVQAMLLVAITSFALAYLPAEALAHVPTVEAGETHVHDGDEDHSHPSDIGGPEKSRAIYGYIADGERDVYRFTTAIPVTRVVRVIVPAYPEHEDFFPSFVVEADGTLVAREEESERAERVAEFEPFSLTTFYQGAEAEIAFEPGIEYLLAVEPGSGESDSGRYVITFGGPEEFTGRDIAQTFSVLPTIWFGAYGGAPARWNTYALIPIAFGIGAAALILWFIARIVRAVRAR